MKKTSPSMMVIRARVRWIRRTRRTLRTELRELVRQLAEEEGAAPTGIGELR